MKDIKEERRHVKTCSQKNGLRREMLDGRKQSKKAVGRRRQQFLDDITIDGYQKLKAKAQDVDAMK